MKKYLMLIAALSFMAFSCTKPDDESGTGTTPGGEENTEGGNESTTPAYKAGDYYKAGLAEGIIAWLDETGEHGLLISLDESVTQWSTEYHMIVVQGGELSHTDGQYNTKYIKSLEDWKTLYPAFAWCDGKNALGLSSWFLPAIDELEKAYLALDAINATLNEMELTPISTGPNDSYWTSVEYGVQGAYAFSFAEGEIASYGTNKKDQNFVRAMRKF